MMARIFPCWHGRVPAPCGAEGGPSVACRERTEISSDARTSFIPLQLGLETRKESLLQRVLPNAELEQRIAVGEEVTAQLRSALEVGTNPSMVYCVEGVDIQRSRTKEPSLTLSVRDEGSSQAARPSHFTCNFSVYPGPYCY